jgi:hypothetical protein
LRIAVDKSLTLLVGCSKLALLNNPLVG